MQTGSSGVNSFRKTGICLVNRQVFQKFDIIVSDLEEVMLFEHCLSKTEMHHKNAQMFPSGEAET